jgi:hypothetical protein
VIETNYKEQIVIYPKYQIPIPIVPSLINQKKLVILRKRKKMLQNTINFTTFLYNKLMRQIVISTISLSLKPPLILFYTKVFFFFDNHVPNSDKCVCLLSPTLGIYYVELSFF